MDINEDVPIETLYDKVKVIFNGRWLGVSEDPIGLYNSLKDKKYKGLIHIYTSITFNINEKAIYIYNDAGRLVRPVFKVRDNKLMVSQNEVDRINEKELSWNDLVISNKIDESVIEYILTVKNKSLA